METAPELRFIKPLQIKIEFILWNHNFKQIGWKAFMDFVQNDKKKKK